MMEICPCFCNFHICFDEKVDEIDVLSEECRVLLYVEFGV